MAKSFSSKRSPFRVLINPRLQLRVATAAIVLCGLLAAVNLTFFFVFQAEVSKLSQLIITPRELQGAISSLQSLFTWSLWLSVALVAGFFLSAIVFSHRVAGPASNFVHAFKRIREGDLETRVRLRRDDEFHEVALAFNQMMDVLVHKGEGSKPNSK